ncbi:uncharacterized mitochondrial protein AtMg00810-like [Nicotiana tomentosiformis]|uniref:uncharacterized mitochondrial protein AtMg00810-like n=1 Tax=Nicotiana tomentosiformis TaxID=4098 RepID=UPI0008786989|nr:uncharacterized mitochondrial protein AtMg00810-like [Nicotiana tomentosiformis]
MGYTHSLNDYSLFFKKSVSSIVLLVVYVDDIILTGDDEAEILALKEFLDGHFKIKDLGTLNYFLGIEVSYFPSGLLLHQHKFISDLLLEYHCSEVAPVVSPLDLTQKLKAGVGDLLPKPEQFRSLIGFFQHLSQFLQSPRVSHVAAALHLLRYLKGTSDMGVFFEDSSDLSLTTYCDSDWAACPNTRRSITGFSIFLGGSLIGWKSKKQPMVSLSSAEAEYKAVSKVFAELAWVARLLDDLNVSVASPREHLIFHYI